MKKSLVMAMAMAMGVTASAYAANPFSDVPAGHWAYDAVAGLAAAGVVDGYGTTFGGEKLMTRYEMAQIVAKAMAKGGNCDKLAAEFAEELDALGVRVAKLEKKVDNVKITGQIRYSYKNNNDPTTGHGKAYNRFRTRLFVNGQINDAWSYTGMLENNRYFEGEKNNRGDDNGVNLKRAYVTGRIGGIKVKGGRMNFLPTTMHDDHSEGLEVKYGFGKVNVTGAVAQNLDGWKTMKGNNDSSRLYMVALDTKFGKLDTALRYWKADFRGEADDTAKIWDLFLAYPVAKDLKLSGEYWNGRGDNDEENDGKNGYEFKLAYKGAKAAKAGSWGLWVDYQNRPYHTYINPSCLAAYANYSSNDGFKGWEIGGNYAFAKNIVGTVRYYDFQARKDDNKGHTNTIWGDVTFSF